MDRKSLYFMLAVATAVLIAADFSGQSLANEGIRFFSGTMQEAIEEAQSENKIV